MPEEHRISVLPEGQVEAAVEAELAGRAAWNDARDAVIAQARGTAEHERVAGLEQQRVHRITPPHPAKQKSRGVANRQRDDRVTRFDG